jgi:hypothetical protein
MSLLTKLTAPELFSAKKVVEPPATQPDVAPEVEKEKEKDEFPYISKQQYIRLMAKNESFAREVTALKLAQQAKLHVNGNGEDAKPSKKRERGINVAETKKVIFNNAFKTLSDEERAVFIADNAHESQVESERKKLRRKELVSQYSKLRKDERVFVKVKGDTGFFATVLERNAKQIKLAPALTKKLDDGGVLGDFDTVHVEEPVVLPRKNAIKAVHQTKTTPLYWPSSE